LILPAITSFSFIFSLFSAFTFIFISLILLSQIELFTHITSFSSLISFHFIEALLSHISLFQKRKDRQERYEKRWWEILPATFALLFISSIISLPLLLHFHWLYFLFHIWLADFIFISLSFLHYHYFISSCHSIAAWYFTPAHISDTLIAYARHFIAAISFRRQIFH
jgi:hypothetical protein